MSRPLQHGRFGRHSKQRQGLRRVAAPVMLKTPEEAADKEMPPSLYGFRRCRQAEEEAVLILSSIAAWAKSTRSELRTAKFGRLECVRHHRLGDGRACGALHGNRHRKAPRRRELGRPSPSTSTGKRAGGGVQTLRTRSGRRRAHETGWGVEVEGHRFTGLARACCAHFLATSAAHLRDMWAAAFGRAACGRQQCRAPGTSGQTARWRCGSRLESEGARERDANTWHGVAQDIQA